MLSTTTPPSKAVTGALAAIIAVVFAAGVIAAATTSGDGETPAERQAREQAERDRAEQERQRQAGEAGQVAAEADARAFEIILANQEACRNRYIPDARARHEQAVAQLREQEAALQRVINELPPGKAKDTLIAQVTPDFESAIRVLEAELRGVETRCRLAMTVYQLTHDSLPRPVPGR